MIGRRGFLIGMSALIAAPAIVRVTSIMPARSFAFSTERMWLVQFETNLYAHAPLEAARTMVADGWEHADFTSLLVKMERAVLRNVALPGYSKFVGDVAAVQRWDTEIMKMSPILKIGRAHV